MKYKWGLILTLIIAGVICFTSYQDVKRSTYFYNKVRVFNEFKYKKELVRELENLHNKHKLELDSLKAELYSMRQGREFQLSQEEVFNREAYYNELSERYEFEESEMIKSYDKRIFNQLRVRLQEYCKIKGVTSLIAYDEESIDVIINDFDITEEVLNYINK